MSVNRTAVKMAQAIIAQTRSGIAVDGMWGPRSAAAYSALSAPYKNLVEVGVSTVAPGMSVKDLSPPAKVAVASGPSAEVREAIRVVAKEYSLDEEVLLAFFSIESSFNPNAISSSGRHFGLGQMSSAAWSEARSYAKRKGKVDFGPHSNWKNPLANARASAAYGLVNLGYLRAKGFTGAWTSEVMYLAHQQGAGGFNQIYRAAKLGGTVSPDVAIGMINNPPQDSLGVTKNPREFFSRWANVTRSRVQQFA
jgi:soluble lytic murein transglycosylase-like protein